MSSTAIGMCGAGIAVFAIAILSGNRKIASICYAIPLAVFGALHLFGPQFVANIVPRYMPARMFWVYFVGAALIAAAVSIAADVAVRWSGLLVGLMMFAFVAMIHLPGAIAQPGRIIWTIVFREMSFGGAGLILAGYGNVGGIFVTLAMIVFGVEHFLHPLGLPGVPLVREMPAWVLARTIVDYVTGAALVAGAAAVLFRKRPGIVLTAVGGWLLVLILLIYLPVMVGALGQPTVGAQVEGVNYFADTLLFTGAILALARR